MNEDILGQSSNVFPVRYLEDTKNEIYNNFPLKETVSKSTFLKYLHKAKVFKKAYRMTDLCDYCEWMKESKKQIKSIISSIEDLEFNEEFNCSNITNYFISKKEEIVVRMGSQESIDEIEKIILKLEKISIVEGF